MFNPLPASVDLSSADKLCKQFGPRTSFLIWIQTVGHSDSVPERIFLKRRQQKCIKTTQHSRDKGMFKNNEAFYFMASHAHICLDFKDQT